MHIKLTPKELDDFFVHGPKIEPFKGEMKELGQIGEMQVIDKEAEKRRSKESKMWDDKDEFLGLFKWDKMTEELTEELGMEGSRKYTDDFKELFWDYRAIM